jgi:hypothetical protein
MQRSAIRESAPWLSISPLHVLAQVIARLTGLDVKGQERAEPNGRHLFAGLRDRAQKEEPELRISPDATGPVVCAVTNEHFYP